jgi:hypothetical protein
MVGTSLSIEAREEINLPNQDEVIERRRVRETIIVAAIDGASQYPELDRP